MDVFRVFHMWVAWAACWLNADLAAVRNRPRSQTPPTPILCHPASRLPGEAGLVTLLPRSSPASIPAHSEAFCEEKQRLSLISVKQTQLHFSLLWIESAGERGSATPQSFACLYLLIITPYMMCETQMLLLHWKNIIEVKAVCFCICVISAHHLHPSPHRATQFSATTRQLMRKFDDQSHLSLLHLFSFLIYVSLDVAWRASWWTPSSRSWNMLSLSQNQRLMKVILINTKAADELKSSHQHSHMDQELLTNLLWGRGLSPTISNNSSVSVK